MRYRVCYYADGLDCFKDCLDLGSMAAVVGSLGDVVWVRVYML